MSEEYNVGLIEKLGWTNRETWCINLWITNEQGWDEQMRELAKQALEGAFTDPSLPESVDASWLPMKKVHTYSLSKEIEAFFEEEFSWEYVKDNENLYNVVREIGSLYRVNWIEIAEHLIDDAEAGNDD